MKNATRYVAWLIPALIGLAATAVFLLGQPHPPLPTSPDQPIAVAPLPDDVDPADVVSVLPRDSIPAIDDPQFETAADADLRDGERIIALTLNGDARAYPLAILSVHEVVNDVVGGEPVAITWCPLCYTALVFSRQVPARPDPLTFGVSGKLLYNTLVIYDRQTETLWSQLYGAALAGPLAGQTLAVYPASLTTWANWRDAHPDGRVLSKRLTCAQFQCGDHAANPRGSYIVDPYLSYYAQPEEGLIDRQIPRETERTAKKRVLGVRVGNRACAYPFDILAEKRLINDELGGLPLLIWFDPATEAGGAFVRRIDGRHLTFRADPDAPDRLVDQETGSRWERTTGTAVAGPLRGEKLSPAFATPAFEFGWYSYFLESETCGGDGEGPFSDGGR